MDDKIYGISQSPDTKDYILVFHNEYCKKCDEKYENKTKWCMSCQISKNEKVDDFIKEAACNKIFIELIPYDQFNNIKEIDKGSFATVYSATLENKIVALKCLHDSQNVTNELLNEV